MTSARSDEKLVTGVSARQYFHESVDAAMHNQHIEAGEDTVGYVVNLLDNFMRAEELFEQTPDGLMLKPLASMYGHAVESQSTRQRSAALRRLGDVALFVAGVFADSLSRKPVDVDYYVSMGGTAYGYLAEVVHGTLRARVYHSVFSELSIKFQDFVDVLGEVAERAHLSSDRDVMRLYDLWARTGSKRAANMLRKAGIEPMPVTSGGVRH